MFASEQEHPIHKLLAEQQQELMHLAVDGGVHFLDTEQTARAQLEYSHVAHQPLPVAPTLVSRGRYQSSKAIFSPQNRQRANQGYLIEA